MTRRELLQRFGIGAAIVPIISGTPLMDAPAKLIEVPNIEPVTIEPALNPRYLLEEADRVSATVIFRTRDGMTFTFQCDTFVTEATPSFGDVTDLSSDAPHVYRRFLPPSEITWRLRGQLTGRPKFL